jgi:hypothetical protein
MFFELNIVSDTMIFNDKFDLFWTRTRYNLSNFLCHTFILVSYIRMRKMEPSLGVEYMRVHYLGHHGIQHNDI